MRNKLIAALLLVPGAALAHVTLVEPAADPGAHYEAHFRIGHGCGGTSPTIALTVSLPAGVSGVTQEAKPGWAMAIVRAGGRISAVTWKGGSLGATTKDDFTVAMTLPTTRGMLAFPALQTCAAGTEDWSEIPAAGQKSTHPAPLLAVGVMPPANDTMAAMPGMDMANKGSGKPAKGLTVSDAWIRALPAGLPSGGYFTLRNTGSNEVVLTGADSPACGMLMLHRSDDKGGMSRMQDVQDVKIAPGGTVQFSPGGYHLMCSDAKPMLKPGVSVAVTLHFKDGAVLESAFAVRNAAGK